jgi:hypothetical protein
MVPGAGSKKTVFTWKLGSSDVSEPAFTLIALYTAPALPEGGVGGFGRT